MGNSIGQKLLLLTAGISLSAWAMRPGYATDAQGRLAKTYKGECWKTSDWKPELALAECEGKAVQPISREVPAEKGELLMSFGSPAHFDLNEAELRNNDKKRLANVAQKVRSAPASKKVVIEGHSDRTGSPTYNQQLSQQRALEAKAYLVAEGVAPDKIETQAMGTSEPLTKESMCANKKGNDLAQCLSPDRRADIYLR